MFIMLFLTTLLLFSLYLVCSGGNKEHDKTLLELIKKETCGYEYDRVFFKNGYCLKKFSLSEYWLEKYSESVYGYVTHSGTFIKLQPTLKCQLVLLKFMSNQCNKYLAIGENKKLETVKKIRNQF